MVIEGGKVPLSKSKLCLRFRRGRRAHHSQAVRECLAPAHQPCARCQLVQENLTAQHVVRHLRRVWDDVKMLQRDVTVSPLDSDDGEALPQRCDGWREQRCVAME